MAKPKPRMIDNVGRADTVALLPCGGVCCIHISLFDEAGEMFADAPFDRDMALRYGRALTRIGRGEDPEHVLETFNSPGPN